MSAPRPVPPAQDGEDPEGLLIAPADGFAEWIEETFLDSSSPLYNADHEHLADSARFGILWTWSRYDKGSWKTVLGQAKLLKAPSGLYNWERAAWEQQQRDWFGPELPDFRLVFYAPGCAELDDASFCALVEHELYHCAQKEDAYGSPAFDQATGRPRWTIRPHDVEEFAGVVHRYGSGILDGSVQRLVQAASGRPSIAPAKIAAACGTCIRRAA